MKLLLGIATAAIAVTGIAAVPANAHVPRQHISCARWHHGRCVVVNRGWTRAQMMHMRHHERRAERRQARLFAMGQRVPVNYGYWTPYSQIPQTYVTQYDLNPDYRYINRGGYIYVVDPKTYAVQRVIEALIR